MRTVCAEQADEDQGTTGDVEREKDSWSESSPPERRKELRPSEKKKRRKKKDRKGH
jgi:hypothetical protein